MDFVPSEQKSVENEVIQSCASEESLYQSAATESESELDRFRSCLPSLTMVVPQINLEDRPVFISSSTSSAGKVPLFIYRSL